MRLIDTLSFDPYDMLLSMILPYDTYRLFLVFSDRIGWSIECFCSESYETENE